MSTSPVKGLGPPLQGGNKPACMALSIRLVAPNSSRSAVHDGIKNDSARDKVVKKFFYVQSSLDTFDNGHAVRDDQPP